MESREKNNYSKNTKYNFERLSWLGYGILLCFCFYGCKNVAVFFFYLYLQVAFSGASSVKLETLGANRICFHPVLASYSLKGSLLSGKVDDFSIFVISYIKESPKWRSAIKSNYSENKKKKVEPMTFQNTGWTLTTLFSFLDMVGHVSTIVYDLALRES